MLGYTRLGAIALVRCMHDYKHAIILMGAIVVA